MPRRAEIPVRELDPDPLYGSKLVSQVVNKVMLKGKKSTAEHIVYSALEKVGERTGKPPVEVLEQADEDGDARSSRCARAVSAAPTTRFPSRCRSAARAR